jgi:hypothetical protein
MPKKQIILSGFDDENFKYSEFIFPYLDQIGLDNYECYSFGYTLGAPKVTIVPGQVFTELHKYPMKVTESLIYKDLTKIKYEADLIIWVAEDVMDYPDCQLLPGTYNWYSEKKPEAMVHMERICRMYPEKKFILMSEQYGLDELSVVKNLKFVDLPPICVMFDKSKINYNVCTTKHNNSKKKWVFLNNCDRIHRIVSLSYILSKNIDKFGHITVSDYIFERMGFHKKIYSLMKSFFQFDIKTSLQLNEGYNILKNKLFERAKIPYFMPDGSNVDNASEIPDEVKDNSAYFLIGNYNNIIKLYEDVKLEILSDTLFFEPTLFFNEKQLQWVYGRNFLIYLGSPRSIQWLRKWGFDVFDDVVNHDYDLIEDPSERMIRAIDDNIHLLDGSTDLDQLWKDREERFNQNCLVADNIQEKFENECKKQILERLDEYCIPYKKSINT